MSLVEKDVLLENLFSHLRRRMPEALFEQWFAGSELMSCHDDRLELGVKNRFFKSWIETRYADLVREAAAAVMGKPVRVTVTVSPRLFAPFRENQEREKKEAAALELAPVAFAVPPEAARARGGAADLNPDFTFDSLVVGSANQLSYAVALRAVRKPGEFGRVYICGEHSVGKSHLLQAVCHETRRMHPDASVVYVTCERFVADFGAAHAGGKLKEFRAKYRECDLLAMDQVQALGQGNKTATQTELLHIIDHLEARGKQAMFAATLAPGELDGVAPKLRDRLGAGFVDRIALPDEAMRAEMLVRKMAERGLTLPEAAVKLMARELTGNVRKLEGTVSRLAALMEIGGMEPTTSCIRMALDVSTPGAKRSVLVCQDVIGAVAEEYGLTPEAIVGRGRAGPVRRGRQVALVLCRRLLGSRYAELGEIFGKRSHATIMSAIKGVTREMFGPDLEGRPVERILFRLGVSVKPEEIFEKQRRLF